jgi:uncharacterized protein YjbJ (UPF0337 family)
MNKLQIKGSWNELKGKLKQQYGNLTDDNGYYERVATAGLAEEFYTELRYFMTKVADKPESVRILVVRHHHRHPSFGSRRR